MLDLHIAKPRRPKRSTTPSTARQWIWPLPKIDDLRPSILPDPIDARRPNVGYETTKPLPRFVPVFAPHDGVILYAGKITITCEDKTFNRYQLWIDHGGGWATRYANLEHVFATPTDRFDRGRKARVRAGDVIGYANPSPLELGFELWRCDDETFGPIEPHDYMHTWIALPWSEHPDNQVAA